MKIGDIFYFVDISTCKVSKHKVIELVPPCTQGQSEYVKFSHPLYYRTHPTWVHINPTPENYPFKNTKFYGSAKCYLVFTEVEDAQRALVDYVLPKKIENEAEFCSLKMEEFNTAVSRMNTVENKLKEQKENFDKKCNALKKKFV